MQREKDLLRNYVKEVILKEDYVTIIRPQTGEEIYNVVFDKDDNIVSGKKVVMQDSEELREAMSIAEEYAYVPKSRVYEKLKSLGVGTKLSKVLMPAVGSINVVVDTLNNDWSDTLASWSPNTANRKGRGEAQVKLAFRESRSGPEPDFQSGKLNLSIKFFGANGSGLGQTGQGKEAAQDIKKISSAILTEMGVPVGSTLTVTEFGQKISEMAANSKGVSFARKIERLGKLFYSLKDIIVHEHGADAILGCDLSNNFYAVTDPNKIQINAIRGTGRIDFYGPFVSKSRSSFESVINSAI